MPFYEYRCEDCGHELTKLVKMSAEPPDCPECVKPENEGGKSRAVRMRKKVSKTGFKLEGGGWYKDGYG